nr:TnsD family Tn7-like transposition protein [Chitinophagaceae bacterium]
SSESVKGHAVRLKLNFNKVESNKIGKGLIVKDKKNSNRSKVKIMRERFLELQKLKLDKQVIREWEFRSIMKWLKLYDPVWLQKHHIKLYFYKNQKSNIDVKKIDKEFVKKLENAFNELVSSKDSRRITKTQIMRKAKIVAKHLNLPLCNEFLNKNSESIEDFQIRRIKNVAEILSANGEIITAPKLLYSAHIWKRTEKVVKAASKIANLY